MDTLTAPISSLLYRRMLDLNLGGMCGDDEELRGSMFVMVVHMFITQNKISLSGNWNNDVLLYNNKL